METWHCSVPGRILGMPTAIKSCNRISAPHGSSDRTFGLVFAGFFLVVGSVPLVRGGDVRRWALVLATSFLLAALVIPRVLAWPNRWWGKFSELLHHVTSPVALAVIYLVGIVPVGILRRLLGRDPLHLKSGSAGDTYWISRRPPARPDAGMERQF
jgi:hypothetical protein